MTTLCSVVAGQPVDGPAGYSVDSPIHGGPVATVASAGTGVVDQAVESARLAHLADRPVTPAERRERCHAIARRLLDRRDEIARAVTEETGRTYAGTLAEVEKAADGFVLAGDEAIRLTGESVPVAATGKLAVTRWRPTGVWAVATPWNFPVNIPAEYLGPLVATGNAAVWKPAPTTPLSASLVANCIDAGGGPPGLVNLVLTDDVTVAAHLVGHPGVVGVGLTGSTATGTAVSRAAAGKRLLLELGGNGPIVVFADADVDAAADAIAEACFSASGQICSAGGRVLAADTIADALAEALVQRAAGYPVGDPYDPAVRMGPVHLASVARRVEDHVRSAVDAGASLLCGGRHLEGRRTGQYLPATVVARVPAGAALNREETFGPVAPVVPLPETELIAEANRGPHALSAAVFTRDIGRVLDVVDQLEFGSVVINDRSTYWEAHLPFGGWEGKGSGTGRVGVPTVTRAVCQQQTISLDSAGRR